jgi:acylpyruvate hydrolase
LHGDDVRFANYRWMDQNRLGVEVGGGIIDLERAFRDLVPDIDTPFPTSIIDLIRESKTSWRPFRRAHISVQDLFEMDLAAFQKNDLWLPLDKIEFLPPVLDPGKVLCVGMNYPDLLRPGFKPVYPVLFLKPTSSMIGHQQPIKIPAITQQVKIEGELAVIISRHAKSVHQSEALSYIAGYTIANDVTASDLERRTTQWATGKILDTFTPMGPYLVTADEVDHYQDLNINTTVNGRFVQSASTKEMIFGVAELISYISQLATLEPGDVILTGSPKRNGQEPLEEIYIHPGDCISITIENLGSLMNPVVEDSI